REARLPRRRAAGPEMVHRAAARLLLVGVLAADRRIRSARFLEKGPGPSAAALRRARPARPGRPERRAHRPGAARRGKPPLDRAHVPGSEPRLSPREPAG